MPFKHILAITSGKGGVGKSTVAVNLAIALHHKGAAVGLMDADITNPNLPQMLGVEKMPPAAGGKLQPAEPYGIKMMSMGFLVDPSKPMIWRGPMLHSAIRQFFSDVNWGDLDYLIVDLPPGTSDAPLSLAQTVPLTGAVIVTQPMQVAVADALRGLTMFEQLNVPIVGVIENMTGDFFGEGGGKGLADERHVPFLGSVPLDAKVRVGGDDGKPIMVVDPSSPAAQAFAHIVEQVIARVGELSAGQDDNIIPLTTIG